jgi:hypothetical protein
MPDTGRFDVEGQVKVVRVVTAVGVGVELMEWVPALADIAGFFFQLPARSDQRVFSGIDITSRQIPYCFLYPMFILLNE